MKKDRKPIWSPWDLVDIDMKDIAQIQEQFEFTLVEQGDRPYTVANKSLPSGYFLPLRFFDCVNYDKCILIAEHSDWMTFFCPVKCSNFREKKRYD